MRGIPLLFIVTSFLSKCADINKSAAIGQLILFSEIETQPLINLRYGGYPSTYELIYLTDVDPIKNAAISVMEVTVMETPA